MAVVLWDQHGTTQHSLQAVLNFCIIGNNLLFASGCLINEDYKHWLYENNEEFILLLDT